jgi:hypothetical protein
MREDDGVFGFTLMVILIIIVGLFIGFIFIPFTRIANDMQKQLPTIKTSVRNGTTTTEIIPAVPTYITTTRIIINGDITTTQILQWEQK